MVCKVLTTFASGNLRWICSPSESVFETESAGGMPLEKSSGFDMSTRTFPVRLSSPASSSASNETAPAVALRTISPWAVASPNVPSCTSGCSCCQALKGGLPYWSGSVRESVSCGSRVPTITSCSKPAKLTAIVLPTTPVPRMPNLTFPSPFDGSVGWRPSSRVNRVFAHHQTHAKTDDSFAAIVSPLVYEAILRTSSVWCVPGGSSSACSEQRASGPDQHVENAIK